MSKCKKWLLNWLKLQQKGGGTTPTGECEITANGVYDVAEYATADVNVPADVSEYFDSRIFGSLSGKDYACQAYLVKKLPDDVHLYSDATTTLCSAFQGMKGLVTATWFDTAQITDMRSMFNGCSALVDVPVYDTSHLGTDNKYMEYMFTNCYNLSDASLDNVLQMCINAPANMPGRNLGVLGFVSNKYPASRIEALPHYNDFISANWSIGY